MKLLFTAILFLILSGHSIMAQDTTYNDRTYTKVEHEAQYPGGDTAWISFLNHHLKYPDEAVNNEIQGTIVVMFLVDQQGNVSEIRAISGPTKGGLRETAVGVVKSSGAWIPATEEGHKVRSYKKIPIVFKLERG